MLVFTVVLQVLLDTTPDIELNPHIVIISTYSRSLLLSALTADTKASCTIAISRTTGT